MGIRTTLKKMTSVAVLSVCGLCASVPANAGIPVIDVASLVQAILSVLDQITAIENQIAQIEGQVDHFKSVTGSRGLGEIMNSTGMQNYIPKTALADYNKIASGYSGLSSGGKALRDASMIYNCAEKSGAEKTSCESTFAKPYEQKAQLEAALTKTNGRMDQIKDLMSQISSTGDEKAIGELNARIAAENAMLTHENSRAELMKGVYDADARAEANRVEEQRRARANRQGVVNMDKVKEQLGL